jgi:ParB-like chromosome segregation protein Spo0J
MWADIDSILVDETIYPRNQVSWQHIEELADALRVGASLPPTYVGRRGNRWVIIDGRHTYHAHMKLGRERIAILETNLPESQWRIEAVRRNTVHGQGLSYQEKIRAANWMRQEGLSLEEISAIVNVNIERLERAIEERVLPSITGGDASEAEVLKGGVNKAFRSGGGTTQTQPQDVRNKQKGLSGLSAKRLFQEAIVYLKNDWVIDADLEILAELRQEIENWYARHP